MNEYRFLNTLSDCADKTVIVRFDFNVPVANGKVVDDYRIKKSLPTLAWLREKGVKIVILSHIEGGSETLLPVYEYLKTSLPITFCNDILAQGKTACAGLKAGDVLLAENIRMYPGEKKNDEQFAKQLAGLGDVYVNDAFSVSHRSHASVVGIPKFLPSYLGLQFEQEVQNLSSCFSPDHPFLFILGGAKFDTKLPLVKKFIDIADTIFIGGALSNDLFKMKGWEIGQSLVSPDASGLTDVAHSPKVVIPTDVVINSSLGQKTVTPDVVKKDETIVDAGPMTVDSLKKLSATAQHILWNGPLGNYENGFKQPTVEVAKMLAEATSRGAKTIVGGGDTLAAILELGLAEDAFSFISTGGGAMLEYLAAGTLPGLEALKVKQ